MESFSPFYASNKLISSCFLIKMIPFLKYLYVTLLFQFSSSKLIQLLPEKTRLIQFNSEKPYQTKNSIVKTCMKNDSTSNPILFETVYNIFCSQILLKQLTYQHQSKENTVLIIHLNTTIFESRKVILSILVQIMRD
jgi:hypothetical protein